MAYVKRARGFQFSKIFIIITSVIALLATTFGAIVLVKNVFFNNPYEKYDVYDETTKQYGTLTHKKQEEKNIYYYSCYFPKFEEEALNQIVDEYLKGIELPEKSYGMKFIQIDYDCYKVYDHYVSLTFHHSIKDENDQVTLSESVSYNYDLSKQTFMTYEDVLRRNYIALLDQKAKENKLDRQVLRSDLTNFVIEDKQVSFYFDKDFTKKISIAYENHKEYIALSDPNIPSLHMVNDTLLITQPEVDPNKHLIAFTFDDGPHPTNTQLVMDEIEKYNGRATFFMLGENCERYPDVIKDVYSRGHEVANHSYSHSMAIAAYSDPAALLDAQGISDELYKTNDAIFAACGYEPKYFRPPYGSINKTLENESIMDIVKWDIDSLDWSSHNPNSIKDIIVKQAEIGYNVILLHDIHDASVEGVKLALKELHAKGYQFVTIDTLLANDKNKYLTAYNDYRYYNVVLESIVGNPLPTEESQN